MLPDSGDAQTGLVGGDSANELRDDWLPRSLTATDTESQQHTVRMIIQRVIGQLAL